MYSIQSNEVGIGEKLIMTIHAQRIGHKSLERI
ncbi:hypothetical protein J2Z66_000443 [Paenibacillus eucommiae]|uniref:Integrase n=1 Tax=Paenibacillus eucommiae TaxID=1355755 RepID=A0ABS4IMQ2_9BACL|nr:hypothetical protein [Paenibacillus eucommiae]